MFKRLVLIAALTGLVACGPGVVKVSTDDNGKPGAAANVSVGAKGDYNLQIFAVENAQIYLVTGPDGATVAARAADGQSAIMPADDAKSLIEKHGAVLGATPTGGEKVNIRIPFVGIDVVSDESGDNAKVRVNAGGQTVEVDANDAANAANVRVKGVDAKSVRDFIAEADGLSAETKADMLKAMGL